ncbi:hypothetical protein A2U01_0013956, partial [Trifolium medium]|nr:hypothetical protein [Trifolium medium]
SVMELLKPMSLDKEVMSLTLRSFAQLEPSKDKFTAVDNATQFRSIGTYKMSVMELLKPMSLYKEVMCLTLRNFAQLEPSKDKFTAVDILQGYLNFVNDVE